MISCPDKAFSREDNYQYYRILRVFANWGVNDPHSNISEDAEEPTFVSIVALSHPWEKLIISGRLARRLA